MSGRPDDRDAREETRVADRPPYPGAPRWVKVFGIVAVVLVLVVVVVLLVGGGGHGPSMHLLR